MFLKQEGAVEKFDEYTKEWKGGLNGYYRLYCSNPDAISSSFIWAGSKEGDLYWRNISKRWKSYLINGHVVPENNCEKLSPKGMYIAYDGNGFNNSIYDFSNAGQEYEIAKEEARKLIDKYPTSYPCIFSLNWDHFNSAILVDIATCNFKSILEDERCKNL